MRREKTLFFITMVLLAAMIAATVTCAIFYMDEEPYWNRVPNASMPPPSVTDAPDEALASAENAVQQEVLTENIPPGN